MPPELYVVGLQEMVDLEVIGSVMCSKDLERMHGWEDLVKQALDKNSRQFKVTYEIMQRKVMFGCYIMLFARTDCIKHSKLRFFQSVKVKTGVKGIAANKGGVALKFNYLDSSFMVMNTHLTSG